MAEDTMQTGRPGPEHEQLGAFVGTFRSRVKLWMGPGDPVLSSGTMVNTSDLGGLFVRQEYTGDRGEGPFPAFEGRGFWGYNQVTRAYEAVWIDNAGTMIQYESGTVDASGTVWTMSGTVPHPRTGKAMTKRSVITLVDPDHHQLEMWFDTGDNEVKAMEIDYTRKR